MFGLANLRQLAINSWISDSPATSARPSPLAVLALQLIDRDDAQDFFERGLPAQHALQTVLPHGLHPPLNRDLLQGARGHFFQHGLPKDLVHHQQFSDGRAAEKTRVQTLLATRAAT